MRYKTVREMLQIELANLQGPEVTRFRRELRIRLPKTVRQAAKAAKMPVEIAQAGEKVQNGAK